MDTHPSKAFIDAKGAYQHDKENQPLAEHEAQGRTGAQDRAQRVHPFGKPSYCEEHLILGCEVCARG